jgi:hypothetical protein
MTETIKLDLTHIKTLLKKAYEWRAKINKRHNRAHYLKTQKAIERFKKYKLNDKDEQFKPNKSEILLTLIWFERCPPINDDEMMVYTLIGLIYKLHRARLANLKKAK